jgi:DNA-directed RNA polymerase subunit beta'
VQGRLVCSTVGRFIFNENMPQDLGYVDREKDKYSLEIDFLCDKKKLGDIIGRCYAAHGNTQTAIMLDTIKSMGYHYSTIGAITISVSDMEIPGKEGYRSQRGQTGRDFRKSLPPWSGIRKRAV